jgi:hypothetical protein
MPTQQGANVQVEAQAAACRNAHNLWHGDGVGPESMEICRALIAAQSSISTKVESSITLPLDHFMPM